MEGFTYEEAAPILKVPIGPLRSRLSRTRAVLYQRLRGIPSTLGGGQGTRARSSDVRINGR